jgi:hypothetical protein
LRFKITKDISKILREQQISEEQVLQVGLKERAKEFAEKGSEASFN